MAIGFGPEMADTDMVVSEIFDNNIVKLYEGIATGYSAPPHDDDSNIKLLGYKVTD